MTTLTTSRPQGAVAGPVDWTSLLVARAVGALALAGVALIHLLDLPDKLEETPYMGVMYIGLIVGALVAAFALVARGDRRAWLLGGGLALATMAGYTLSRTTGLPQATGDIGNWLEPLGLASLFVEGTVVALAAWALGALRRR